MEFELLANYERTSNSVHFYRKTSTVPYSIKYRLALKQYEGTLLQDQFKARYVFNNEEPQDMVNFLVQKTIDIDEPKTVSFTCLIYNKLTGVLVDTKSINMVVVDEFPKATFVAYPALQFNSVFPFEQRHLNEGNFEESIGNYFYGEGHTETIHLKCIPLSIIDEYNSLTPNWFVGNKIDEIYTKTSLVSISSTDSYTATVKITSSPNEEASYPISVWTTNDKITLDGPFIYFDDETGQQKFYPFFSSSLTPNGQFDRRNDRLKNNIEVKCYPTVTNIKLQQPPFNFSEIVLPADGSKQTFIAALSVLPTPKSLFAEDFEGSTWTVHGTNEKIEWISSTDKQQGVKAYQFDLSYILDFSEESLMPFHVSYDKETTVTLTVTAFKNIALNAAPYDWKPKTQSFEFKTQVNVKQLPVSRLYTNQYYYLTGAPIVVHNTFTKESFSSFFTLFKTTVTVENETSQITFSGSNLYGKSSLSFKTPGKKTFYVSSYFKDVHGQTYTFLHEHKNFVCIVEQFENENSEFLSLVSNKNTDVFDANSFLISPYEWGTADNINKTIENVYKAFIQVAGNLNSYKPSLLLRGINNSLYNPNFKWSELSCTYANETIPVKTWQEYKNCKENTESIFSWKDHENRNCIEKYCMPWSWIDRTPTNNPLTTWKTTEEGASYEKKWEYEPCDSTCKQEYEIEWNWKALENNCETYCVDFTNAKAPIDWKNTQFGEILEKRWKYEPKDIDVKNLVCKPLPWIFDPYNTLTLDTLDCPPSYGCSFTGIAVTPTTNQILVCYPTQLNLINHDYEPVVVAATKYFEPEYEFTDLVDCCAASDTTFVVLDATQCKVGVFSIKNNKFSLLVSWGKFGAKENAYGFNSPSSCHIDEKKNLYIADTGNACIKIYTLSGKYKATITHTSLTANPPKSITVNSEGNIYTLGTSGVIVVFNSNGEYLFEFGKQENDYTKNSIAVGNKGNSLFVACKNGILKYLKTGKLIDKHVAENKHCHNFTRIVQDSNRNVLATTEHSIYKFADALLIEDDYNFYKNTFPFWTLEELLIKPEEYVQPWVYTRAFQRLWDNIELLKSALSYKTTCKTFESPLYAKQDLVIGQNEIVTNSVLNRLIVQIIRNLNQVNEYYNKVCVVQETTTANTLTGYDIALPVFNKVNAPEIVHQWSKLHCSSVNETIPFKKWKDYSVLCKNLSAFSMLSWKTNKPIIPSKPEKYDIVWTWNSVKTECETVSGKELTWENTQTNRVLEKLWRYEPIEPQETWRSLTPRRDKSRNWKNTKQGYSLEKLWDERTSMGEGWKWIELERNCCTKDFDTILWKDTIFGGSHQKIWSNEFSAITSSNGTWSDFATLTLECNTPWNTTSSASAWNNICQNVSVCAWNLNTSYYELKPETQLQMITSHTWESFAQPLTNNEWKFFNLQYGPNPDICEERCDEKWRWDQLIYNCRDCRDVDTTEYTCSATWLDTHTGNIAWNEVTNTPVGSTCDEKYNINWIWSSLTEIVDITSAPTWEQTKSGTCNEKRWSVTNHSTECEICTDKISSPCIVQPPTLYTKCIPCFLQGPTVVIEASSAEHTWLAFQCLTSQCNTSWSSVSEWTDYQSVVSNCNIPWSTTSSISSWSAISESETNCNWNSNTNSYSLKPEITVQTLSSYTWNSNCTLTALNVHPTNQTHSWSQYSTPSCNEVQPLTCTSTWNFWASSQNFFDSNPEWNDFDCCSATDVAATSSFTWSFLTQKDG